MQNAGKADAAFLPMLTARATHQIFSAMAALKPKQSAQIAAIVAGSGSPPGS